MGGACCKETPLDLSGEVELNHFNMNRSIGKGAFGKVKVVTHKGNNQLYALKYISKEKCIKMKAVENMIQERNLLIDTNYLFITNLRFAFQDDENLFMVLDLMIGGDLRFHLDRSKSLGEERCRFYAAELAIGLNFLHSKSIVHRDLKPDNVLLCKDGHAHLTDFNIAVKMKPGKQLTAVAGSMAYMAPEQFDKTGYGTAVDWWGLGIVVYELMATKRPFKGDTNEKLIHSIRNDPLLIPPEWSPECQSFVKGLLNRDPKQRLGTPEMGGKEALYKHPWFKSIDWEKLEKKEVVAPFIPDQNKANFDATHELEELLMENDQLVVKAKKITAVDPEDAPIPAGQDPEMVKGQRALYHRFKVYDYTKPQVEDASQTKPETGDIMESLETDGVPISPKALAEKEAAEAAAAAAAAEQAKAETTAPSN